jgi:hypothetical protein
VALLIVARLRVRSRAVPVGLVVLAALLVVMLITKPGTGDPRPELRGAGNAGLVLGAWVVILGIVDTVHLAHAGAAEQTLAHQDPCPGAKATAANRTCAAPEPAHWV